MDLREQVCVHYDKVTGASCHNEQMKDLMTSEIFMTVIEDREFQCINDAANRVNDTACKKPSERCRGQCVQDLGKGENTGPSHSDIQYGRKPFRAINPECFDQDSGNRDAPYKKQKRNPGLAVEYKQTDRSVCSGNQYGDHHMIDFL